MTPPPPPPPDEASLIRAAQNGDRRALARLLRDHEQRIPAVGRRITGLTIDPTFPAVMAVVRGLPRFDGRARFSTWVYRVATNTCLDELRRRKRRPRVGLPEQDGVTLDVPEDSGVAVDDAVATRMEVDAALAELPEEFRAAVVLRDLCQLDYAEISEVLDIPAGTVRSRIARGRRQLADRIVGNQTDPSRRPTSTP